MINAWHIMTNDGTYSFNPERKVPNCGYVVAIKGYGIELYPTDTNTKRVENWLESHMWSVSNDPDRFVGSWYDAQTHIRYLDIVRIISDKLSAIVYAQSQDQIAVYDLSKGENVYLAS